ncbi:MAG: hypothetical protein GXP45_00270 [bacterium]|nr:hypothetical protein [bacterium]
MFMDLIGHWRNLRVQADIKQQEKCLLSFYGDAQLQTFIDKHFSLLKKLS